MKHLKVIGTTVLAGVTLLTFALSDGEAQARGGQGQRLRDGSCINRVAAQGTVPGQAVVQPRGYGRLTGTCTGLCTGNGSRLRVQDGTGYGYGARGK
jgi:hypothetical protein